MLRSQINPHFLFNTLNNISALIEYDRNKAQETVEKLSEMMSYMVYEGNEGFIYIKDELNFIKNYIHLQEIRIGKENFAEINTKNVPGEMKIATMLLIPLVENAFKYCDKSVEKGILIHMTADKKEICFMVKNIISKDSTNNLEKGGFGLKNLKERLVLLYPEKHSLEINKQNNFFSAKLCIQQD